MKREEFEEKIKYFGERCYAEAAYREYGDRTPANVQVSLQMTVKASIMAEFDRLRWHYPENGEVPSGKRFVIVENYKDSELYLTMLFDENKKGDMNLINKAYRWKYIDWEEL